MNYLDEGPDYLFPFTAKGCLLCLVSCMITDVMFCLFVWLITGGLR